MQWHGRVHSYTRHHFTQGILTAPPCNRTYPWELYPYIIPVLKEKHPQSVQVADIPKVSRQEAHKHNRSQSVYSRWMSPEQESHRHPKPSPLWPSDSVESFYSPAPATWGHDHMLGCKHKGSAPPLHCQSLQVHVSVSVFLTSLLLVTHTFFSQWSFLTCFHVLKWL